MPLTTCLTRASRNICLRTPRHMQFEPEAVDLRVHHVTRPMGDLHVALFVAGSTPQTPIMGSEASSSYGATTGELHAHLSHAHTRAHTHTRSDEVNPTIHTRTSHSHTRIHHEPISLFSLSLVLFSRFLTDNCNHRPCHAQACTHTHYAHTHTRREQAHPAHTQRHKQLQFSHQQVPNDWATTASLREF